jgi:hypothetical protein
MAESRQRRDGPPWVPPVGIIGYRHDRVQPGRLDAPGGRYRVTRLARITSSAFVSDGQGGAKPIGIFTAEGESQSEIMHREQFLAVGPGVDRAEAGLGGEGAELGDRVFV